MNVLKQDYKNNIQSNTDITIFKDFIREAFHTVRGKREH